MNKIGAGRLLKLADFLDMVHPSKFNLNEWVSGRKPDQMSEAPTKKGDCGTTACAVGWLPVLFPKSWSWRTPKAWYDSFGNMANAEIHYKRWPNADLTQGQKLSAAADFFSIDYDDASELFMPDAYRQGNATRAKTVAKRIRSLVAEARG